MENKIKHSDSSLTVWILNSLLRMMIKIVSSIILVSLINYEYWVVSIAVIQKWIIWAYSESCPRLNRTWVNFSLKTSKAYWKEISNLEPSIKATFTHSWPTQLNSSCNWLSIILEVNSGGENLLIWRSILQNKIPKKYINLKDVKRFH